MVNCNPETVSTDYDTSDRLYFEPLTLEDVLEVIAKEQPEGVIVQYGGQTPLKLSRALEAAGAPIIGTSPDSIDMAEDRERFQVLVKNLGLKQPANATARTEDQAVALARTVGFPLVVRPSYVLGGRAMEVVFNEEDLRNYMTHAVKVSNDSPVLLDRFLDVAIEVDVDACCDGEDVLIGGIMEHVEQAGVHSGDSGCSLPPAASHESGPGAGEGSKSRRCDRPREHQFDPAGACIARGSASRTRRCLKAAGLQLARSGRAS
jgi:carbamoyl-phosphate synthase large subunit